MKSHEEIYRVAFEVAQADLAGITAELERLRVRKEHVERLILVLKPILGEVESPVPTARKEELAEQSSTGLTGGSDNASASEPAKEVETSSEENVQPLGVGADPFQRRVEHVLGIGAGIRDVRQYTRQF